MHLFSSFRTHIVRNRFNTIADTYDLTIGDRRRVYNDAVDQIVSQSIRNSDRSIVVLDAGCGTGMRWAKLRMQFPNAVVHGIDSSPSMIEIARTRGLDEVLVCDFADILYPDSTFGVITCLFFPICYLASKSQRCRAISEFYRILKPNGLLFIDAINMWHVGEGKEFHRSRAQALWDLVKSWVDPRLEVGDKIYWTTHDGSKLAGYMHAFSRQSFAALLESAGFVINNSYIVGYNSGAIQSVAHRGQLLSICTRPRLDHS